MQTRFRLKQPYWTSDCRIWYFRDTFVKFGFFFLTYLSFLICHLCKQYNLRTPLKTFIIKSELNYSWFRNERMNEWINECMNEWRNIDMHFLMTWMTQIFFLFYCLWLPFSNAIFNPLTYDSSDKTNCITTPLWFILCENPFLDLFPIHMQIKRLNNWRHN